MAQELPINFQIPQDQAIASYSFVDIVSKAGYLTLYGMSVNTDASTEVYRLSPLTQTTANTKTLIAATEELTFDIIFPRKEIADGFLLITIPQESTGSISLQVAVDLITSAGTTAVFDYIDIPDGTTQYTERVLSYTLDNLVIPAGSTFRLKVKCNSETGDSYIWHYPLGASSNFPQSGGTLTCNIPLRINL